MVPQHLLSDFAEVCGIHAGDGWMSSHNYEVGYGTATYEAPYFIHVLSVYRRIFPMKHIRLLWRARSLELRFQSKESQQILMSTGFPRGPKLERLFIPQFVTGNETYLQRFLRGLIDTDGHVYWRKNQYGNSSLILFWSTSSPAFAQEVRDALRTLGFSPQFGSVQPSSRDGITRKRSFRIALMRRADIKRYLAEIGFNNPRRWNQAFAQPELLRSYGVSEAATDF